MKKLLSVTLLFIFVFFSAGVRKEENVLAAEGNSTDSSAAQSQIDRFKAANEYNIKTKQSTRESHSLGVWFDNASSLVLNLLGGLPMEGDNGQVVYNRGAVGDITHGIAFMMETPVANTETAVADFLNSAGIAQPAYAQGLGFASLDPILNTWKTFRNMAYLIFVVIFMVIGFLIMMRQKVGGQTVVTAQQAIPHIIVALLLVTFSYAIAGLLIDLMYLVMYLLLVLFNKGEAEFLDKNFLTLGWMMISNGAVSAYAQVQGFMKTMENSLGSFGQEAIGFLGGLTLAMVVALAITFKVFELFFELLKTYVIIVLTVAFAPMLLALGAIPGKNVFGQWMKDLVGNLAAFPTVLLVLIVFDELTGGFSNTTTQVDVIGGGFQPPYLFSGVSPGILSFIVGLGMLMIMPEIVKQAKTAMGAKEGIFAQFARDIGQSMNKGWDGGEIVPGLGFTKVPGGKAITREAATLASSGAGYVAGGIKGISQARYQGSQVIRDYAEKGGRMGGRFVGDLTDAASFKKGRKDRKETPAWDVPKKIAQLKKEPEE